MNEIMWSSTVPLTDELKHIRPLLLTAVEHGKSQGFIIPYSYWLDNKDWLYIKWRTETECEHRRNVVRYKFDKDNSLVVEPIKFNLSAKEKLRGINSDEPVTLITGDTHRFFKRIEKFCEKYPTTKEDTMIILGDVGINYTGHIQDWSIKKKLSKLPISLFCIHGNHEMRPSTIPSYKLVDWHGGKVFVEDEFPSLLFAKDGEIYKIDGKEVLVIGGAYSVDKMYRLQYDMKWFADEQPSIEIKKDVEYQLTKCGWKVDVVLSHTVPYKYQPFDKFLPTIDQSTVDHSTEQWLESIERWLKYDKWYAGHFHCDRVDGKLQIMHKNVELFCSDRDLKFSME